MTEEPYRWLEAVENRREYVREQLKGGSPAFGAKLCDPRLLHAAERLVGCRLLATRPRHDRVFGERDDPAGNRLVLA